MASRTAGSGHAIPYGVYDVGANTGFVNVGTDHNTAALAVESIRRWWDLAGKDAYPARGAAAGQLRRRRDQRLAEPGLEGRAGRAGGRDRAADHRAATSRPGTTKWNKIEHRLFSQITLAWRGRPLTSYDVIMTTIAAVRTTTGLAVTAVLDAEPLPHGDRRSATSR